MQLQVNKKSKKALACILHDCKAPEPKDEHLSGEDHCNNFVISRETETERYSHNGHYHPTELYPIYTVFFKAYSQKCTLLYLANEASLV